MYRQSYCGCGYSKAQAKERGGSDGTAKTKESKKRYFAYDLMRTAAMLLIVFYHMNCEWSARLMEARLS